jgi:myo-inositol-1(or 4)-monophosphatase
VWAVSIGLLEHGQPLAGAVVAPALGLAWTGYRGGPALRNAEPCRVSATAEFEHALLATGFPPNRERAPENNLDTFAAAQKKVRGVRRCGSAAIDMCMVADGTYDAYWERRLNAWDLAAGGLICECAGLDVRPLEPVGPSAPGVLVAPPALADAMEPWLA